MAASKGGGGDLMEGNWEGRLGDCREEKQIDRRDCAVCGYTVAMDNFLGASKP